MSQQTNYVIPSRTFVAWKGILDGTGNFIDLMFPVGVNWPYPFLDILEIIVYEFGLKGS